MARRAADRLKRLAFSSGRKTATPAVGLPVGLEPLEDGLAVVQHHGGRVELERLVGRQLASCQPSRRPADRDHVVGVHPPEAGSAMSASRSASLRGEVLSTFSIAAVAVMSVSSVVAC
jgi:hypothetical protein